ncbi:MAG: hypothetical protein ACE147_00690 [Candidatus Methylomirabilales bacterium]
MARLIEVLRRLAVQRPSTTAEPASATPFRQATVVSVNPDGTVGVQVDGKPGESRAARATDEPLQPGHRVWTTETERGVLVIGGVR